MKKLLLISSKVPHYRVSVYNYLHRRFAEEGWDFEVMSDSMQSENRLQVQFEFLERSCAFAAYKEVIREREPDAVVFHMHLKNPLFWQLIHWVHWKKIPIINWSKGGNLDNAESRIRYHLFNHFHSLSDAIILYSERQKPLIKLRNQHKVFAANNTVNFEDYPEISDSKEKIKNELDLPFEKMALFAGTMGIDGERKKVDHLIEVFRGLKRKDVGLVLVGGGITPEQESRLNPDNTRYLGQVHDEWNLQISKIFKASDVFVMPGHVGLAATQAFYWGLPLITEDGHHPPEIQYLKDGINGFMVPENDLEALEERMLFLLDNGDVRRDLSRNAREGILREGSIEGMFLSFKRALHYALTAGGRPRISPPTHPEQFRASRS